MNTSQNTSGAGFITRVAVKSTSRPRPRTSIAQGGVSRPGDLVAHNRRYANTGGVSAGNRSLGFLPAFYDAASGAVFPSCFADGSPAPIHVLDGLPGHLVLERDPSGHPLRLVDSLVAGFLRQGRFYTRQEAAEAARADA